MKKSLPVIAALILLAASPVHAQGCCSHHGGVAACNDKTGMLMCEDKTLSQKCTCKDWKPQDKTKPERKDAEQKQPRDATRGVPGGSGGS